MNSIINQFTDGLAKVFSNKWMVLAIAVLLPFALSLVSSGNSSLRALAMAILFVMLALGLNIVVGMAGLLDLGYIAFFALGAYTYALVASPHLAENFAWIAALFPNGLHANIFLMLPICALMAGVFGVLLGAPTLKLRGDYLAIVTLGFGEIIRIFMNNMNTPVNITNGPKGMTLIEPAGIRFGDFNWNFDMGLDLGFYVVKPLMLYYYLFLILTIVIILVNHNLAQSRIGRAWVAIREDEIAAKAMGINTRNLKLLAFGMGASFGGVSGALFAALQGFISPESFTLNESIAILAMVVLGGIGHIPGVIFGAILLAVLPEVLRHAAEPLQMQLFGTVLMDAEILRQLLYGLAMVLIMLYKPKGLWPKPQNEDAVSANSSNSANSATLVAGKQTNAQLTDKLATTTHSTASAGATP
jgi:branched-chain amino acid transport system permease protein